MKMIWCGSKRRLHTCFDAAGLGEAQAGWELSTVSRRELIKIN